MDHDQRFKETLREFIREFFQLFFPSWEERIDFASLEWLQQEVFPDPPRGERHAVDLVAKVRVRQAVTEEQTAAAEWIALIHVEVESRDSAAAFRRRMFDYFRSLNLRHALPVLPVALYLRVGLDGVGWDVYEIWFWEHRLVRFEYPYVGLPALDAFAYLHGTNWLGVALSALMRIPANRRAEVKAEALERLATSPQSEYRRFLLCDCVEAYLPLEGPQLAEYERLLLTERYKEARMLGVTSFEKGVDRGQRLLLQRMLERRFGPLNPAVLERLDSWPSERLAELADALLAARSLRDLGLEDTAAV